MSDRQPLAGVLPVFQTPYRDDETIDAVVLDDEINWLYDCGADGIVMAMVSEVLRLSSEEREELAALACKFGSKRGAVVISVGAESNVVAERFAKHAQSVGADAVILRPIHDTGFAEVDLPYRHGIMRAFPVNHKECQ